MDRIQHLLPASDGSVVAEGDETNIGQTAANIATNPRVVVVCVTKP